MQTCDICPCIGDPSYFYATRIAVLKQIIPQRPLLVLVLAGLNATRQGFMDMFTLQLYLCEVSVDCFAKILFKHGSLQGVTCVIAVLFGHLQF